MLKKILLGTLFVGLIGLLIAGGVIRTMDKTGQTALAAEASGNGRGNGSATESGNEDLTYGNEQVGRGEQGGRNAKTGSLQNGQRSGGEFEGTYASPPTESLNDSETDILLYMREEEKLARDVYLALYDIFGQNSFQNIANSEQAHMDAIARLLDQYGLEDPTTGLDEGEFKNPELQSLYNQMVDQGSQSLVDALRVGAAIEEIDILDLQQGLNETTNSEIEQVFQNLLRGSESHLRAFVNGLESQGESYQAQYMDAEDLVQILEESSGNRQGNGNRGQGAGQGQKNR